MRRDRFDRCAVNRPVEGDDAAERRNRIGGERLAVGIDRGGRGRRTAGVRMLDDHARRMVGEIGECLDAFPGRIAVG